MVIVQYVYCLVRVSFRAESEQWLVTLLLSCNPRCTPVIFGNPCLVRSIVGRTPAKTIAWASYRIRQQKMLQEKKKSCERCFKEAAKAGVLSISETVVKRSPIGCDAIYTVSQKTTLLWLATTSTYINRFGRNVAKEASSQMILYFPTSPN